MADFKIALNLVANEGNAVASIKAVTAAVREFEKASARAQRTSSRRGKAAAEAGPYGVLPDMSRKAKEWKRGLAKAYAMQGNGAGKRKPFGIDVHEVNALATNMDALGRHARAALMSPIALAANFEAAMLRVDALSGGSLGRSGKLGAIEKKARELGGATEFTATEVAEGFQILTQAGFKYEEQLASITTTLDLATAAQISMDQAATLTANSIGGFGLTAQDSERIGNVMARTANASQISIAQLGDSFKYAAPGAKVLGVSLEETATAVAVLGKAGRFGGQAGTDLRAFMNRLSMLSSGKFSTKRQKQAAKMLGLDRESLKKAVASGDLQHIAQYLHEAIEKSGVDDVEKTAALQAIFQERGATAAAILMASASKKGAGGWDDVEAQVNDTNITLKDSAQLMRSGVKGGAVALKSALEELGITAGEHLAPALLSIIQDATQLTKSFGAWAKNNGPLIRTLAKVAATLAIVGPVMASTVRIAQTMMIMAKVAGALNAAAAGAGLFGTKAKQAKSAFGTLSAAHGALGASAAAATAIIAFTIFKINQLRETSAKTFQDIQKNSQELWGEGSVLGGDPEAVAKRKAQLEKRIAQEQARVDAAKAEEGFIDYAMGGSNVSTTALEGLEAELAQVRSAEERIRQQGGTGDQAARSLEAQLNMINRRVVSDNDRSGKRDTKDSQLRILVKVDEERRFVSAMVDESTLDAGMIVEGG